MVNTCCGKEDIFIQRYHVQINRMETRGEYSVGMRFGDIKRFHWIPEEYKEQVLEFIYKNNAEDYDETYDGICFNKKKDAELVVDYLNTLYETYLLRGEK